MRANILLLAAIASLLQASVGYPAGGWAALMNEIQQKGIDPNTGPNDSSELIGDLISPGATTPVGQAVKDIITGNADAQSTDINYSIPGTLGTPACRQDTCCVWKFVTDAMVATFRGESGRCNALARGAVRLGFHDAGAWNKTMTYGGADGSLILTNEVSLDANRGLEEIVNQMREWYAQYQPYGAGAADLIQWGATVATVVCPLGPRIRSFVGRKDSAIIPPDGLLPSANDTADHLMTLFDAKTIRPNGLVALVGAHTTSQQRFFDPAKALYAQDTTPGVWDTKFYPQTTSRNTPRHMVKFPSDVSISEHPECSAEWKAFADPIIGQAHWNDAFAKEYVRLSMLGVYNINDLTECTQLLPPMSPSTFNPPDAAQVSQWINGGYSNTGSAVAQLLNSGQLVTNNSLASNGVNPADAADFNPPPPGSQYYPTPEVPAPVGRAPTPAAPSYAPPAFSLPPVFSMPPQQSQPVAAFSARPPPPESQTDQPLPVQTAVNSVQASESYVPPKITLGLPSFATSLQTARPVETSLSGAAGSALTTQLLLPTVRPVEISPSAALSLSTGLSFPPTSRPVEASSPLQSQIRASSQVQSGFASVSSGVVGIVPSIGTSALSGSVGVSAVLSGARIPSPTPAAQSPKGATSVPVFRAPDPSSSDDLSQTPAGVSTSRLNIQPSAPAAQQAAGSRPTIGVASQQPKASTSLLNVQAPATPLARDTAAQEIAAPSAAPTKAAPTQQTQQTEAAQQTPNARAPAAAPSELSAPAEPAAETPRPAKASPAAQQTQQTTAQPKQAGAAQTGAAQQAPAAQTTPQAPVAAQNTGHAKSSA